MRLCGEIVRFIQFFQFLATGFRVNPLHVLAVCGEIILKNLIFGPFRIKKSKSRVAIIIENEQFGYTSKLNRIAH